VRYVWRHLPLSDVHLHAEPAAEAAEAAAAQHAFWPMHDLLLAQQEDARSSPIARTATTSAYTRGPPSLRGRRDPEGRIVSCPALG
jgi:protein-disulfide isomerase